MELIIKPINEMIPASYNPRLQLSPGMEEYEKLKKSIQKYGFITPVVWNRRTGNIVSGHQRLQVAKDLGIDSVPTSIVDLPENKEKTLNIALNKIIGDWDQEKLYDLLQDIGEENFLNAGFSELELEQIDLNIDDYVDKELLQRDDSRATKLFAITLTFPIDKEQMMKDYIKKYGKDDIVQLLIKTITEESQHA